MKIVNNKAISEKIYTEFDIEWLGIESIITKTAYVEINITFKMPVFTHLRCTNREFETVYISTMFPHMKLKSYNYCLLCSVRAIVFFYSAIWTRENTKIRRRKKKKNTRKYEHTEVRWRILDNYRLECISCFRVFVI